MNTALPVWSFILCDLAVWRVTHLLTEEDGPWDLIANLRQALGKSIVGKLLDCFYCLSLWLSLPPAIWLGSNSVSRLLYWLALSGAACLLQKVTLRREPELPAIQLLQEEPSCAVVVNETR